MKNLLNIFIFLLMINGSFAQQVADIPLQNELLKRAEAGASYDILLKGNSAMLEEALQKNNIKLKYRTKDWIAVHVNKEQLLLLSKMKEVESLYFDDSKGFLLNDRMLTNANVIALQEVGIYDSLLNGDDVIIGFIDAGLDYTHPDFINEDGSSRILYFWDQKEPIDSNEIYEDYGYGRLIEQSTFDQWLDSSYQEILDPNDWYGHGTTVVGAACSNGRALEDLLESGAIDHDFHGVAPHAAIIMVASDFNRNNWLASVADGVHFMLDKAAELNKAIVINLSIGSYSGSHDGLDPVGLMINEWFSDQYNGRALVCAGGNSRTLRYHLGYTSSLDTNYSLYNSFNGPAELGRMAYASFWLDSVNTSNFKSALALYDPTADHFIFPQNAYHTIDENLDSLMLDTIFSENELPLAIVKRALEERGDQYQLQVQFEQIAAPDYKMVLFSTGDARIDTWSAQWLSSSDIAGPEALAPTIWQDEKYRGPDSLMQTVSSFSCAENVITVANYVNRNSYVDVNNTIQNLAGQVGSLALHSSRGPTRDRRIKPDISASGELVLSSGPYNYREILLNAAPYKLAQGGWHMRNGGSSMASPIVAGIAALYLQRCPYAKASEIKEAIIQSGYQDIFTNMLPNINWGYGKVNGAAALDHSIQEIEINIGSCTDGLIELSSMGNYDHFQWSTGDTTASICVEEGSYWISAVDERGCVQRSANVWVAENGIIERKGAELKIYPNPSNGNFHVDDMGENAQVQIRNLLGQDQAFDLQLDANGGWIQLRNPVPGIYILIEKKSQRQLELIITH